MPQVTVPSYGLLSGLAEGLKQGLLTYQTTKNIQHQQQLQDMTAGAQRDEDGNLSYTPEKQQEMQAKGVTNQATIDANDPNSEHSKRLAEARGVLVHAGNNAIPTSTFTGKSAAEQKDLESLGKADVTGNFGMLKQLYNPLIQVKQGQLDETRSQNAAAAGNKFDSNPIILAANKNIGSLKRSMSVLDNPNKPVTSKDLNLAYTDYINAVAAGGAATEGKITRELPETWATDWNSLKQRAGVNDDLRQDPRAQQLISMLKENIHTVHKDLTSAANDQAKSLGTNYGQTSNTKQKAVVAAKLKQYDDAQQGGLLGDTPAEDPQIAAFAKANNLDYARAQMILKGRGYGQQ